jgi:hypothetical protein
MSILRKQFNEPRIHFVINCASYSCPKLRNEAIQASKLETQLNEATYSFLADKTKNEIARDKVILSSIFDWYAADFTKQGTLIDFLNRYTL